LRRAFCRFNLPPVWREHLVGDVLVGQLDAGAVRPGSRPLRSSSSAGIELIVRFDHAGLGITGQMPGLPEGSGALGQARYTFTKGTAAVDGCAGLRLHDLRHTCASLAISSGANVKVVQRLLGHKSATLTLDRYGHLFPDDLDAVADAFDEATQSVADWLRTGPNLRIAGSDENSL
jgi:integrase